MHSTSSRECSQLKRSEDCRTCFTPKLEKYTNQNSIVSKTESWFIWFLWIFASHSDIQKFASCSAKSVNHFMLHFMLSKMLSDNHTDHTHRSFCIRLLSVAMNLRHVVSCLWKKVDSGISISVYHTSKSIYILVNINYEHACWNMAYWPVNEKRYEQWSSTCCKDMSGLQLAVKLQLPLCMGSHLSVMGAVYDWHIQNPAMTRWLWDLILKLLVIATENW